MLNTRELDILNILWNSGVPMTSSDIVNAGRGLSQSTVQAVLRKLLNANLVKVSGITHSGNVLSRQYEPEASSKNIILHQFLEDYRNFSNIISKEELLTSIVKLSEDSEKRKNEINELKKVLANLEKGDYDRCAFKAHLLTLQSRCYGIGFLICSKVCSLLSHQKRALHLSGMPCFCFFIKLRITYRPELQLLLRSLRSSSQDLHQLQNEPSR